MIIHRFLVVNAMILSFLIGCGELLEEEEDDEDIPCQAYASGGSSHTRVGERTETGFVLIVDSFSDSECSANAMTIRTGNRLVVGAAGESSYQLVDSFSFTPRAQRIADSLNTDNYCGFSDWSVDQSKELLNVDCSAATTALHFLPAELLQWKK